MSKSILSSFQKDDVVIFVGAHPDDETLMSPILAYAADICKKVVIVSSTKGESGWNLFKEDLSRTLAQVRQAEFEKSVKILNSVPVMYTYTNGLTRAHPKGLAVLDLKEPAFNRWKSKDLKKESSMDIYERWSKERGDPAVAVLNTLREFGVTIIITMDPVIGCTKHKEHTAISEATKRAVAEYRKTSKVTPAFYYIWCKGEGLPEVPSEAEHLTGSNLSGKGKDYVEIASKAFECYESQFGGMASINPGKRPILDTLEWFVQRV